MGAKKKSNIFHPAWAAGLSVAIHAAVLGGASLLPSEEVSKPLPVNVRLAEPVPLPPEEKPIPEPMPVVAKKVPRPSPVSAQKVAEQPRVAGVTQDSVREASSDSNSSVAVPIGNAPDVEVKLGDDRKPMGEAGADNEARCSRPAEILLTEEGARAGVTSGELVLDVVVTRAGKVVSPKLVKGIGYGLDELALEVVQKIVCEPAMRNGEAVAVKKRFSWRVEF